VGRFVASLPPLVRNAIVLVLSCFSSFGLGFALDIAVESVSRGLPLGSIQLPIANWLVLAIVAFFAAELVPGWRWPLYWSFRLNGVLAALAALGHAPELIVASGLFFAGHLARRAATRGVAVPSVLRLGNAAAAALSVWNPLYHSDEENLQWAWLRAVEWGSWPLWLSVSIGPVALLFVPLWKLVVVFGVANLAWSTVRYKFVAFRLASVGAVLGLARWITVPAAFALLLWRGHWGLAIIAAVWPSAVTLLGAVHPPQIGRIQIILIRQLGYEPTEANPLHHLSPSGAE